MQPITSDRGQIPSD